MVRFIDERVAPIPSAIAINDRLVLNIKLFVNVVNDYRHVSFSDFIGDVLSWDQVNTSKNVFLFYFHGS